MHRRRSASEKTSAASSSHRNSAAQQEAGLWAFHRPWETLPSIMQAMTGRRTARTMAVYLCMPLAARHSFFWNMRMRDILSRESSIYRYYRLYFNYHWALASSTTMSGTYAVYIIPYQVGNFMLKFIQDMGNITSLNPSNAAGIRRHARDIACESCIFCRTWKISLGFGLTLFLFF